MRFSVAVAAAIAVIASAIGGALVASPAVADPLDRFYTQGVTWDPCDAAVTADCAYIMVPLDYADPTGPTIEVGISRARATGTKAGSLLLNPGGPGMSGSRWMPTILARIPPEVRARFDIVGYDPRGVGRSTRVMCGLQRYAPPGPRPWNIGEIETYLDSQARWMRTCLRDSGRALLENVSSAEAARDLDIVRAALGDRRLHYWGISYGAYIGALYAQFFPDRIGKMMLDSSMSTTASVPAIAHLQAKGLQKEFTAWARWCGRTVATCPVRGSAATVTERVVAWLDRLHRHPIPMGSEPEVTYHEVVGVIAYAMGRGGWPGFRSTNRIVRALRDRDGATLRAYTESASLGRDVRNEIDSQAAINCLDRRGEVSALRTIGHMREWSAEAPVFGEVWAVRGSACTGWPVANRATTTPLDVRDAPPVLLLAVRTDPISPLILSRQMQDQLHGSRLVVWEGMGHGASLRGDACIDTTLSRFFARGRLPADGKTCPQR